MRKIRLLRGEWEFDPDSPLGPAGGFGIVYLGAHEQYGLTAVKELKIDAAQAAHRELRLANELVECKHNNVVAIYDAGQDSESDRYYVVMEKADYSLQDYLNRNGKVAETEAVDILFQILNGLNEVPGIVHRDLKPGNVLFKDGLWKISDFGIARFVEETTSLRTLKECLSPYYAAPEQWEFERVSDVTDIYALGCIAHTLITGNPPFDGQTPEDLKAQHLHADPPKLPNVKPITQSTVSMMLRKLPGSRPSRARLKEMLKNALAESTANSSSKGLEAIAIVGATAAERAAKEESDRLQKQAVMDKRRELSNEAIKLLDEIVSDFFEKICAKAPTAVINKKRSPIQIQLGGARLSVNFSKVGNPFPEGLFSKSGWDVICAATIRLDQSNPTYVWSASLWYTNLGNGGNYRWYETSYYCNAFYQSSTYSPFSLENPRDADVAHSRTTMGAFCEAYEPIAIDDEHTNNFYDRWARLFSKAYNGNLRYPSCQPFDPNSV